MKLKSPIIIILVVAIVLITPLVLEFAIFRNHVYSVLTNGEWASFLGSYLGGAIGGLGTLLALYFTTKETRSIQSKTDKRADEDRAFAARLERKHFADSVAQSVAEYVTDISTYYYSCRHEVRLDEDRRKVKKELDAKQQELKERYDELGHTILCNAPRLSAIDDARAIQLKQEETEIKDRLQHIEREIETLKYSREKSISILYLLRIELNGIELGQPLLEQMALVHQDSANENIFYDAFNEETDKLLELTAEFTRKYVQ